MIGLSPHLPREDHAILGNEPMHEDEQQCAGIESLDMFF
jgi:hypothetical protein